MEHGKNRFFNICEAYQKMLGKSDSIGRDARRYNAINESLKTVNEDFGMFGNKRPENGFENSFKQSFIEDIYFIIRDLLAWMTDGIYFNDNQVYGTVINKRVITWMHTQCIGQNKVKCRLSMVDGNPSAFWRISDSGEKIKNDTIIKDIREWLDNAENNKQSAIRFEKLGYYDNSARIFDKMRIRQTGKEDWNVRASVPMFPAGTVIKAHLGGLGYLTIECITDYWIYSPNEAFSTTKRELKELADERLGKKGNSYWVRNNWFTPPNLPESVYKKSSYRNMINEDYDVDAYDSVYIGRTNDYYSEDEDDSVFSRPTWTWAESPDDKDFAKEGPVYKLTDDGKRDFFEWLDAYQVGYSLGSGRTLHGRNESPEEEWNFLTSPSNGLSVEVEGNSSISAQKFESARRRNRRGKNINESSNDALTKNQVIAIAQNMIPENLRPYYVGIEVVKSDMYEPWSGWNSDIILYFKYPVAGGTVYDGRYAHSDLSNLRDELESMYIDEESNDADHEEYDAEYNNKPVKRISPFKGTINLEEFTSVSESAGSARIMGNRRPESNPTSDEIDTDDEPDEIDDLNEQILKVKELIGWNPVGGISIVTGTFKPKYDHSYSGPFKPMSLDEFIKSATLCCTAEAHDVVMAETITVGGEAYLADEDTFEELVKDPYLAADYPEYAMYDVVLSFDGYGKLSLVRLLNDSFTGHHLFGFRDVRGRDYVLSKILSSYPFLRDYVDNSDRKCIEFSLPPSMAMAIQGAADKRSQRYPTIKDEEDEERNYYGTYDSETGRYDSKYNIDVKNAYKDRFGGGKDYVG